MHVWIRPPDSSSWRRWPSLPQALASLEGQNASAVALVAPDPQQALDELKAAIRLVRVMMPATAVSIVTPHPTRATAMALMASGADHVWIVGPHEVTAAPRGPLLESPQAQGICPALHVDTHGSSTLSVCGEHHDRMVLARSHFERWCLGHANACPHRRGAVRA